MRIRYDDNYEWKLPGYDYEYDYGYDCDYGYDYGYVKSAGKTYEQVDRLGCLWEHRVKYKNTINIIKSLFNKTKYININITIIAKNVNK